VPRGKSAADAVLTAWKAEIDAFYAASALGDPSYRRLALGVIAGSPEDDEMISYLSAQAASGVVGPSSWHIGNVRVVSLGRSHAVVTGCSYDRGSHLRTGDLAVAPWLGGGPGLTAYLTDMTAVTGSWKLDSSATSSVYATSAPGPCHRFSFRGAATISGPRVVGTAHAGIAARLSARPGGNGGGAGSGGTTIWSWVWWLGNPQGPGPYTGGDAGGTGLCVWHDVGLSMSNLNSALANSGLPASFWTEPRDGGNPGVWSITLWATALFESATASDHFDLVACPTPDQVPPGGGDVESDMPPATTPTGKKMYLWILWDTVPDPPASKLPPLIYSALARASLPAPAISTSPSSVDEFVDATVVNFPTWFWVRPTEWRTVIATARGGGLVATVWATPVSTTWQTGWDFAEPSEDPEGGTTSEPESLDLVCAGPGVQYDGTVPSAAQDTSCQAVFTQSSFGTYQRLEASIAWQVNWALSSDAGVVGGEGLLAESVTSATRPLRVLQVESVIVQG